MIDLVKAVQDEILIKLSEATEERKVSEITYFSSVIEKTDILMKRLYNIKKEIDSLTEEVNSNNMDRLSSSNKDQIDFSTHIFTDETSNRMRGEIRRNEFIRQIRELGINLVKDSGATFKTPTGELIGIAYALTSKKNHWSLGLPQKKYHALVFICEEKKTGEIYRFILSGKIFHEHKESFSRKDNQYKFNIHLRENRFHLSIPPKKKLDLYKYLNRYDPLKIMYM